MGQSWDLETGNPPASHSALKHGHVYGHRRDAHSCAQPPKVYPGPTVCQALCHLLGTQPSACRGPHATKLMGRGVSLPAV